MFKIYLENASDLLPNPLHSKEISNMSHHNTLLSQTLSLVPRHIFQKLEARHKTGRSSRKFGFKEQFTVMAFIQLAARRSMRDGLRALSAVRNRLYHLGLKPVARSTFARSPKSNASACVTSASLPGVNRTRMGRPLRSTAVGGRAYGAKAGAG